MTYEQEVEKLEAAGLSTSDAQAVADAGLLKAASQETAAQRFGYRIKQRRDGLSIESEIKLEDVAADPDAFDGPGVRFLKLSTSKSGRGGISSFAHAVVRRDNPSSGYTSETSALFQDYSKHYNATPCARVTEKALIAAHVVALETFADHIAAAKVQYGIE